MTQYGYEPLSPTDSGSTLLERLNGVVPVLLTNHKGAARPGYVQPGMMWIDDSGALWLLNLFDGASDVPIATVDPAKHAIVDIHVPTTRKLKVGAGLSIDGIAGIADNPAEADLTADRLLTLVSLSLEVWKTGTDTTTAAISPAQLAAAITALAGGAAPKRIVELSASGNYTPAAGTKFVLAIMRGGGGGGGNKASSTDGSGGGEGGIGFAFVPVAAGTPYVCVVGAGGAATGGGGTTSMSIAGVTFSATGGAAGASGNYSAPGAGGIPSSQCLFGQQGTSGASTAGGNSLWWMAGSAAYGRGGNGGSQAGVSSAAGSAGTAGHITVLEFGS